jgi:periplasmic nitrate reductase NapD
MTTAQDEAACEELHIASLVVYSTPRRAQSVADVLPGLCGAEVHAVSPEGKLVVTLEAATGAQMMDKIKQIQCTEGVLSAALVYQCADTLAAMNEEISHDDGQTALH